MKVVYNSFAGRYSDSPRAIYEALVERGDDLEHVWLADPDHLDAFPASVTTVPFAGAEGVRALESADVLVSNTHVDRDWVKSPGTVYVQTWHGTPLKRIHYDAIGVPTARTQRLSDDVDRWDHLLSPNRASTGPLQRAFGYPRPLAETGYPRNDVLSSARAPEIRAAVRRRLAIGPDKTVVLYAPTWRDDLKEPDVFPLQLDLEAFERRLGRDHVLLLRLHYFDSARVGDVESACIRNVSMLPEVSDLYLAADALLTDYSSTMFDFAITAKPIIFFTYDLAHYRDTLRGFYFDFLRDAPPGPVVDTTDQVLDAIADLPNVARQYAGAYRSFRRQFCHLEDGGSTARVLERFFTAQPAPVRAPTAVLAGQ